ncbi:MAG: M20/M25/M40 family metallo-hydrolase [Candidatus Thorarchaeota archaeon]|nr:M20/M25/M40 family metallo-hydrolase [Candidatus Thorarchaeota archaeon]
MREVLDDAVGLLQEMIRNRCVNPPGDEMRNIRTVEKYLDSQGIQSEVFESSPNRGNLLAEIRGDTSAPSLMLGPAHVDVVPVQDESRWRYPPFGGVVEEGCVWGRGALDMLYIVAAQTVAFAHLHNDGFRPKGTLKLLIVSDEECAGEAGALWMIKHHPERVKVDYLVTEPGGEPVAHDRAVLWYGEKGTAWTRLTFTGTEGHGSMPFGVPNAITRMAEGVKRLAAYQPARTSQFLKPLVGGMEVGRVSRLMVSNSHTLGLSLKLLSKRNPALARFLHALSQMTISPNVCAGGTKTNVIPGRAKVDLDIRILPGQDEEYVRSQIVTALGELAQDVTIERVPIDQGGDFSPGSMSSLETPLVTIMQEVVSELTGGASRLVPMILTGATDSRFFRRAFGTNSYGFALHSEEIGISEILRLPHGDNERVPLRTLELTIKAYYLLAQRFLQP